MGFIVDDLFVILIFELTLQIINRYINQKKKYI